MTKNVWKLAIAMGLTEGTAMTTASYGNQTCGEEPVDGQMDRQMDNSIAIVMISRLIRKDVPLHVSARWELGKMILRLCINSSYRYLLLGPIGLDMT
jgi:hypothetical protein